MVVPGREAIARRPGRIDSTYNNMDKRLTSSWQALGPGLLWAGAAIGVSHLVQSTRAGASFGLGLLGVVLFAHFYKYPAFSFGPRYAAATGTSLLEGYRRQGRWALWLYGILTIASMFTIQAAVTFVTAALFTNLSGWHGNVMGIPVFMLIAAALLASCSALLAIGQYRWLDRIIKFVVVVLAVTTLICTVAVLDKVPFNSLRFLPQGDWVTNTTTAVMLCGLIGWMPGAIEISVWHSLWTLAKRRESGITPTVSASLFDFNVGYFATGILAICFMLMGAGTMYTLGTEFPATPAAFAAQIVRLYTENLGRWAEPVVTVSAFAVMFSTTLTVVDGFPRAVATLTARFAGPEEREISAPVNAHVYWITLVCLFIGSLIVIGMFLGSLKAMADLAATMSLLIAPTLAWLNHRVITADNVPASARPGTAMRFYSGFGILIAALMALYYVTMRWVFGLGS